MILDAFTQCIMNRASSQRMQHPGEFDLLNPMIQRRIEETIK
jgi:hypothetical protein